MIIVLFLGHKFWCPATFILAKALLFVVRVHGLKAVAIRTR